MEWNNRTAGLIAGALLVIAGIGLLMITEEAGTAGSDPSGGTADQSDETRPYLWHGILVLVVGLGVGAWGWTQDSEAGS